MTITIEKGTQSDIKELGCLYDTVCSHLERNINYPGWKKGIYPVEEDAAEAIKEGTLFAAKHNNTIIGTVILHHKPEDAYRTVNWHIDLDYTDIFLISTFAIHPDYQKQGLGRQMMDFIIDHCKKMNAKAIRLDVHEKNTPAISLYKSYGFQYIDKVDLGYGEYGLADFELYQKIL